MKACRRAIGPKAPVANTKPLVRYKGQMLDFHFLNNRHNRVTVTLMSMLSFKKSDEWKKGGRVAGSRWVLR